MVPSVALSQDKDKTATSEKEPSLGLAGQGQPGEAKEEPSLGLAGQGQPGEAKEEPSLGLAGQEQPGEAREEPSSEQPEDTTETLP